MSRSHHARSATSKFFALSELVELTLSSLPMQDLLFAQGVCQYFEAIINSSPRLQRLLFFRPVPESSVTHHINPLLENQFPHFFNLKFIAQAFKDEYYPVFEFPWGEPWTDLKTRDAFLRAEASWRRMLLVQPPVPVLVTEESAHKRPLFTRRRGRLEAPPEPGCEEREGSSAGIRMGTVYDAVVQIFVPSPHDRAGFDVRWIDREGGVIFHIEDPKMRLEHLELNFSRGEGDLIGSPYHVKSLEYLLSGAHDGAAVLERAFRDVEWEDGWFEAFRIRANLRKAFVPFTVGS